MDAEATTHLSESGQVNIPTAIREFLQWRSGMELKNIFSLSVIA